MKVYNGRIILKLQEIKKVAQSQIKLPVLLHKIYFLTPKGKVKNSHHGMVQQLN